MDTIFCSSHVGVGGLMVVVGLDEAGGFNKFGGRAHRLHETSRFERVNNLWLYVGAVNA